MEDTLFYPFVIAAVLVLVSLGDIWFIFMWGYVVCLAYLPRKRKEESWQVKSLGCLLQYMLNYFVKAVL